MNQAEVSKLVSKLRIKVPPKHRKLPNPKGPEGRLDKLRKTLTGLIKYERIELNYNRADEARQYAERVSITYILIMRLRRLFIKYFIGYFLFQLISEAIRHGDCHKPTMDTANFWLLEKELVHKLFKVLVPRFENSSVAYTKLYNAPKPQYARVLDKAVLELKGNPYPELGNKQTNNKYFIQNILLDAAKHEYRQAKYAEVANKMGEAGNETSQVNTENAEKINEKPMSS